MIRTFCDRCDEPVLSERVVRVRIVSVTTPHEAHRQVGMRYDPATDETFSHELCDLCAASLMGWLKTAPAKRTQRAG